MSRSEKRSRAKKLLVALAVLSGLVILVGFVVPAVRVVRVSRPPPEVLKDRAHLWEIAIACQVYAIENESPGPLDFMELYPDHVDDRETFVSPLAERYGVAQPHYALERGLRFDLPGSWILAYDRLLANHGGQGRHVAVFEGPLTYAADGAILLGCEIEWWSVEREAEFQARLAAQREVLVKVRGKESEAVGEEKE